jgi:hypothetical protein
MDDYMAGYLLGVKFLARYRHCPRVILQYAKWHMKRYRQTDNDAGFVDALLEAYS